ncbi:hypothetical protein ACFWBN_30045 [Streptomyces sp. NPDC059989]|uniref:hypothetical protein n=1 Tax=Streptomyces sp. NPDC059989 TaxID=3347026 RepID=UPI0036C8EE07
MSETSVSIKSNKAVADGFKITISGIMRGYFGQPARIVSIEVAAGQHGTGDNAPAGTARKDGFKVTADAPSSDRSVTIDSNNNTRPGTFTHGAAVSVQVKVIDADGNEVGGEQTMLQVYEAIRSSTPAARSAASGSGIGTVASRTTDRWAVQSASGPVRSMSASSRGWSPIVSQSSGYWAALRHPHAHIARKASARGRRARPSYADQCLVDGTSAPLPTSKYTGPGSLPPTSTPAAPACASPKSTVHQSHSTSTPPLPHVRRQAGRIPSATLPRARTRPHPDGPNNQRSWIPAPRHSTAGERVAVAVSNRTGAAA